jgi:hypothetical protein
MEREAALLGGRWFHDFGGVKLFSIRSLKPPVMLLQAEKAAPTGAAFSCFPFVAFLLPTRR